MNPVISPARHARGIAALAAGSAMLSLSAASATAPRGPQPNIVFILVDDLGWGDVRPYGQTFIDTPNFDRLARQGMTFTNGYAPSPICSASRAASLTGRSPARLHFEFVTKETGKGNPKNTQAALIQPSYPRDLPLSEISLAEAFAPAGYATGYYGKWHLTQENGGRYLGHGNKFGPAQQGFAETSEERGSHPYNYQGDLKKGKAGFGPYNKGEYAPDALGDEAVDFIRRHKDERFFLFFSQYYVHYPLHTRCKWLVEKYEKRAAAAGLKLNDAQITYATFVETMDHLLGRVLDALDKYKLSEDTLVVLTSDNGGDPRVAWNGLRGSKWTLYEGGVREPFIVRWPGVTKAGTTSDVPVIATDLMPTFCEVAGVKPPAVPLDGISILPLLTGKTDKLDRDTLIWHFPFYHAAFVGTKPCSSIRKGGMKLIHFYEDGRSELYDLSTDPMEKNDLSKTQPRLVERLKDELLGALKQQNARFPKSRSSCMSP